MAKKAKKDKKNKEPSPIDSLAANFDRALYDEQVRLQENELRAKCAREGTSNRLYKLSRTYGSVETAYFIWAQEKVSFKIRKKTHPDETEEISKSHAQHAVAMANRERLPTAIALRNRANTPDEDDWYRPARAKNNGWRTWGHG